MATVSSAGVWCGVLLRLKIWGFVGRCVNGLGRINMRRIYIIMFCCIALGWTVNCQAGDWIAGVIEYRMVGSNIKVPLPISRLSQHYDESNNVKQWLALENAKFAAMLRHKLYVRIDDPTNRQNCVGFVTQYLWGGPEFNSVGVDDFFWKVVNRFGADITLLYSTPRKGDIVVFINKFNHKVEHVAIVDGWSNDPKFGGYYILSKDSYESLYRIAWNIVDQWGYRDKFIGRYSYYISKVYRITVPLEIKIVEGSEYSDPYNCPEGSFPNSQGVCIKIEEGG